MRSEPELVNLILSGRWRKAANLAAKKPQEVQKYRLSGGPLQGSTVLHLACSVDAPIKLVTALLTAHPGATSEQNLLGFTPLHVASHHASPMIVKTLLGADISSINLRAAGNISALSLLCMKYGDKIQQTLDRPRLNKSHLEGTMFCFRSKADHLIKAEYHRTISDRLPNKRTWRMLHACAGLVDCPSALLLFAMKLHPHQLSEPDEDGNLPLHIAASVGDPASPSRSLYDKAKKKHTKLPRPRYVRYAGKDVLPKGESFDVISCLVDAYPQAATIRNKNGELPLQRAIKSGKGWHDGISSIHRAHPAAITQFDKTTKLYPFMYAAAAIPGKLPPLESEIDEKLQLEITFELFRACPEVSRYVTPDSSRVTPRKSQQVTRTKLEPRKRKARSIENLPSHSRRTRSQIVKTDRVTRSSSKRRRTVSSLFDQ